MAGISENDKCQQVLVVPGFSSYMENRKYSVLIIAFDCHYSHVERFIRNLKYVNPLVDITLFGDEHTITEDLRNGQVEIIDKKNNTNRHSTKIRGLSKLLNKVTLIDQVRDLASTRKFDIVNIHFPQYYMCFVMRYLHKLSDNVILTPWGSDVLRVDSKMKRRFLKYVYRCSDMVTVGSRGAVGKVIHKDFGVDEKRMVSLAWGSETIDFINDHLDSISQQDAKRKLGLENKYVVSCGYNAFFEQRHLEIIAALAKVKDRLPSNLVLLFPVTYGTKKRKEYIEMLKRRCVKNGLTAFFYEDYLSVEGIFYLRRASDMFIHVQTTDGGNSTIMEYCICGSKIIHGSWMHYKWLDYTPRFYFPVDDLNDLPDVILTACQSETMTIPEEVLTIIRNRGWKQKMMRWNEVFMSCLSNA